MSKRKSRRVTTDNTKRSLPALNTKNTLQFDLFPSSSLQNFEDRRRWHPEGDVAPAASFSQPRHRLTIAKPPRKKPTKYQHSLKKSSLSFWSSPEYVAFRAPERVLVCVRRQRRKEVLFAKRKAGKIGQRKPKFNYYSSISCRR